MIRSTWFLPTVLLMGAGFVGCMDMDEVSTRLTSQDPDVNRISLSRGRKTETRDRYAVRFAAESESWELTPSEAFADSSHDDDDEVAINLSPQLPERFDITGLAVDSCGERALVTFIDTSRGRQLRETVGLLCDLQSGSVVRKFSLPEGAAPYGLSPDGDVAVLSRRDAILSRRETLYLLQFQDSTTKIKRWRPNVPPGVLEPELYDKESEILWASFVGKDRIVTTTASGLLCIWEYPTLKKIGMIPGVAGEPTLTPDNRRVLFAVQDGLLLLDPHEPQVIGRRRIVALPEAPVLAVHPDGERIAIGGKHEMICWRPDTDELVRTKIKYFNPQHSLGLTSEFDWTGNLIRKSDRLYDFDQPVPVWSLELGEKSTCSNGLTFAIVRMPYRSRKSPRDYFLRSFRIPVTEIEQTVNRVMQHGDVFALRPGDSVEINVRGLPIKDRARIQRILAERLSEDFHVTDRADVVVKAFYDEEKTYFARYGKSAFSPVEQTSKLSYRGRMGNLQIWRRGEMIWSRMGIESAPRQIDVIPQNGKLDFFAGPDPELYTDSRLPHFIRGEIRKCLGQTELTYDGVKTEINGTSKQK